MSDASSSGGSPGGPPPVPTSALWSAIHTRFYAFLANQQSMLEDRQRTGTYAAAILGNPSDFQDRVVLDVGAGSGILSIFAARAGARHVHAVEASPMARHARALVARAGLADRITVHEQRVEALSLPERVDVVVSEPLGIFGVHERMLESFLDARDRFLAPGGALYPSRTTLRLAPFCDPVLHASRRDLARFWEAEDFHGVDLRPLAAEAAAELFAAPAVGPVDPRALRAAAASHELDFRTITAEALRAFDFDFEFAFSEPGELHGLAGWFDAAFDGPDAPCLLQTGPEAPMTHWWQVRFLLRQPVPIGAGSVLRGRLSLAVNASASYTVRLDAALDGRVRLPAQHYRLQEYFHWWQPCA